MTIAPRRARSVSKRGAQVKPLHASTPKGRCGAVHSGLGIDDPARLCIDRVGLDIRTIGVLSLVGLPYTVKFLWAPVMDRHRWLHWRT